MRKIILLLALALILLAVPVVAKLGTNYTEFSTPAASKDNGGDIKSTGNNVGGMKIKTNSDQDTISRIDILIYKDEAIATPANLWISTSNCDEYATCGTILWESTINGSEILSTTLGNASYINKTIFPPLTGVASTVLYILIQNNVATNIRIVRDSTSPAYERGSYVREGVELATYDVLFATYSEAAQNFTIRAFDVYNGTSIRRFNAEIDGYANYSTNNSAIVTDINMSQNITYNITIWNITNYFNRTYEWKTNETLIANVTPYTTIFAKDILTDQNISNFTITYNSKNYKTTEGIIYLPLFNSSSVVTISNATVSSLNYSIVNRTLNATPYLRNYTFKLYSNPSSVSITFYDERTGKILDDINITLSFSSDAYYLLGSTSDGTYYKDNLAGDDYIISYNSSGYGSKFYYLTLSPLTGMLLSLYLTSESTTGVSIYVYDLSGNPLKDKIVKVLRHVNNTNSYLVVAMGSTNADGLVILPHKLFTEVYKHIIESSGVVKLITAAKPIYATTINYFIDVGGINNQRTDHLYHIQSSLINTSSYLSYFYNDAFNQVSQGCLYIYSQDDYGAYSLANTTCLLSSSGQINISISPGTKYRADGTIYLQGTEYLMERSYINLKDDTNIQTQDVAAWIAIFMIAFAIIGFIIHKAMGFILPGVASIGAGMVGFMPLVISGPIGAVLIIVGIVVGVVSRD